MNREKPAAQLDPETFQRLHTLRRTAKACVEDAFTAALNGNGEVDQRLVVAYVEDLARALADFCRKQRRLISEGN